MTIAPERPTEGRLVDQFEYGPGRPDLPDLGADLRLQPVVRALPVLVGPPRPATS